MSDNGSRRGLVFHADRPGYIGFGIIFGAACLLMVFIVWRDFRATTVAILVCIVAAAVITFYWLHAFRLEIGPETLTYRSIFTVRSIRRADIDSVTLRTAPFEQVLGPTVRLTITLSKDEPPLVINAKVFSREAIQAVKQLK